MWFFLFFLYIHDWNFMPCMHDEAFIIYVLLWAHNFLLLPLEHFTLIPLKSCLLGSFLTYIINILIIDRLPPIIFSCLLGKDMPYLVIISFFLLVNTPIYRNQISFWKVWYFLVLVGKFCKGYYDPPGSDIPRKTNQKVSFFIYLPLSRTVAKLRQVSH